MHLVAMGKVHPQQNQFGLDISRSMRFETGIWHVNMRQNSVVAIIYGEETPDMQTYVTEVRSIIGGIVDAVGFEIGAPLRFELTHLVADGTQVFFVQPGWPHLRLEEGASSIDEPADPERINSLTDGVLQTPLIRYALTDVQRAIEFPDDTAFYCYRAVESLRLIFLDEEERDAGSARKRSWESLRRGFGIDHDSVMFVKVLADARRHGGHTRLTEEERKQCILLSRRAIRAAIAYVGS